MAEVDYETALKYPARGDDALKRILLGAGPMAAVGLLALLTGVLGLVLGGAQLIGLVMGVPLGLVAFALWLGYWVRVARATFAGEEDPPGFENVPDMLRDGAWASAVHLVYWAPAVALATVLLAVVVAGVGLPVLTGSSEALAGAVFAIFFLWIALAFLAPLGMGVYAAVVWYPMPISLCQYARTGSFRSAFSREALRRVGLSREYAVPWAVLSTVTLVPVALTAVSSFMLFGYLLLPVLPFVLFYTGTAAIRVAATLYAENDPTSGGEGSVRAAWNRVEPTGE